MTTHNKLIRELTVMDQRNRSKPGYNRYALGIYFQAAEGVETAEQFAEAFIPTRDMHGVAKRVGFPLEVEKGHWTLNGERVGN